MMEFIPHTRQEEREPDPRPVYAVVEEAKAELARFDKLLAKLERQIEELA